MPHSFSLAVSMNLEHSIKEGSHERYPVHLQCLKNIKKIKYPDFQAMTFVKISSTTFECVLVRLSGCFSAKWEFGKTKLIPKWTILRFQYSQCCLHKTKTISALTLCAYANTKNIFCKFCTLFAKIKEALT